MLFKLKHNGVAALFLSLLCLLILPAYGQDKDAGQVQAKVDRQTLFEGDTLALIISLEGQAREHEPDLTPLDKDFEVIGTGTSTQLNIVNGQRSMKMEWRIQLDVKRNGSLTIPAISIGPYKTEKISIEVLPAKTLTAGQTDSVFLELDIDPKSPYVQQQVLLTLRLFHSVSLLDGSLDEPESPDLVIERMGEDSSYETKKGSQRFRVIERKYALFPQKSGVISIPELRFQGRIPTNNGYNRFLDRGRLLSRKTEAMDIQVRPKPDSYPKGAVWLPANDLELEENWPDTQSKFEVGSPITRTLVLSATGLTAAQLPEFEMSSGPNFSIYPDQAISDSQSGNRWLGSVQQQKFALVPNQSGAIELPEIRIPWWDTSQDKLAEAIIPAKTLEVEASANQPQVVAKPQPETVVLPEAIQSDGPEKGAIRPEIQGIPAFWWPWIALFLGLGWFSNLWFCLGRKRVISSEKPSNISPSPDLKQLKKAALNSCRQNDVMAVNQSVIQWSRALDYPANNLGRLAQLVQHEPLQNELNKLERSRYGQAGSDWTGEQLAHLLDKHLHPFEPEKSRQNAVPLPPLYPEA